MGALLLFLAGTSPADTFTDAAWSRLGAGISGLYGTAVSALCISGTNLYVGGWFTGAGGLPANGIAAWNGSAWTALGAGVAGGSHPPYTATVYAVAGDGTNVFAGGSFTAAGSMAANYIARWDGNAWFSLGSGVGGTAQPSVWALAVSGGHLYVGGSFTNVDGLAANYIAQWDGNAWSALGSGVNGTVCALAVSGTNLYAGGRFDKAGGAQVNGIAKWNGSAWSALGGGVGGVYPTFPFVYALAVNGSDLYAGGPFSRAGTVNANRVARWNGNTWSALNPGFDADVAALAISGNKLYAGGYYFGLGKTGVPACYLASWDGSAWQVLGSGMGAPIHALLADGRGHMFAGGEFTTAGTNACSYIAEADLESAPAVPVAPQSQTAEAGSTVALSVRVAGDPAPDCQWLFNGSPLNGGTNWLLSLPGVSAMNTGAYSLVASNSFGSVTSAPALLNVIAAVPRRPLPAVKITGQTASIVTVEYANPLLHPPVWNTLGSVNLTNPTQFCGDPTLPMPSQRFYRAWQAAGTGTGPVLQVNFAPALTLTGHTGDNLRLDYINPVGPTDAWVTLDTVKMTNTSQLYFDVTAPGLTGRLYRIVPVP